MSGGFPLRNERPMRHFPTNGHGRTQSPIERQKQGGERKIKPRSLTHERRNFGDIRTRISWAFGKQDVGRKHTPQCRSRRAPRPVARLYVKRTVSHVETFLWGAPQKLAAMQNRSGCGLVLGPIVWTDNKFEVSGQIKAVKRSHSRFMSFRRNHAQWHALIFQAGKRRLCTRKNLDKVVVHALVMGTVQCHELIMHGLIIGEVPHLHNKRLPHLTHEYIIGDSLAEHFLYCIPKRRQNEVVGIDERPVQVEQDSIDCVLHEALTPSQVIRVLRRLLKQRAE